MIGCPAVVTSRTTSTPGEGEPGLVHLVVSVISWVHGGQAARLVCPLLEAVGTAAGINIGLSAELHLPACPMYLPGRGLSR